MRDFSFNGESDVDIEQIIARRRKKIHKQQLLYTIILAIILFVICIWIYRKSVYVEFDGYVSVDNYVYRTDDDIYYLESKWQVGDMILPGDTVFSYVLADNFYKDYNKDAEPTVIVRDRDMRVQYGLARQDLNVLKVRISELERQLAVENHNIKLGLSTNHNQLRTEQELSEAKEQYASLRRKLGVLLNALSKDAEAVNRLTNNGFGYLSIDDMRNIGLLDSLGYVHHSIAVDTAIVTENLVPAFSLVLRGEPILKAQGLNLKDNNMSIVAYVMPNEMQYINYNTKATVIVTDNISYTASVMMLGARTENIPGELRSRLSRDYTASIVEFAIDPDQNVPLWSLINNLPVTIRINKLKEGSSNVEDYLVFNTATGLDSASIKHWVDNKKTLHLSHKSAYYNGDSILNEIPPSDLSVGKDTTKKNSINVPASEDDSSSKTTVSTQQPSKTIPVIQGGNYHVVACSSTDKAYAEKVAGRLRKKGYKYVKILYDGNDNYRIVISSYPTSQAAEDAAIEYRKIENNKSIWVLYQKSTK